MFHLANHFFFLQHSCKVPSIHGNYLINNSTDNQLPVENPHHKPAIVKYSLFRKTISVLFRFFLSESRTNEWRMDQPMVIHKNRKQNLHTQVVLHMFRRQPEKKSATAPFPDVIFIIELPQSMDGISAETELGARRKILTPHRTGSFCTWENDVGRRPRPWWNTGTDRQADRQPAESFRLQRKSNQPDEAEEIGNTQLPLIVIAFPGGSARSRFTRGRGLQTFGNAEHWICNV